MAEEAQVKLGADIGDLKSNMAAAAAAVLDSLAKINDSLNALKDKSKEIEDAIKNNNESVKQSFASIEGSLSSITGGFGKLKAAAEALLGFSIFSAITGSALTLEDEVRKLEIVFGMGADAAEKFNIQIKLAGLNADTFTTMAQRLGIRLRTNEDEFKRLGVEVRDGSKNFLPMRDILQNVYERMQDFKAGTDQDLFVMDLLGRRAVDFAADMQRFNAAEADATKAADKFSDLMGGDAQNKLEEYRRKVNELGLAFDAFKVKTGLSMIDSLESLIGWLGKAIEKFQKFDDAVRNMPTIWTLIGEKIGVVITTSDAYVGASEPFQEAMRKNAEVTRDFAAEMAALPGTVDSALAAFRKMEHAGPPVPRKGPLDFTDKPKGGESDVAGFEAVLKASESHYNNLKLQQGSFETWSETMTRDYWAQVLEFATLSAKDREAIQNKYYDAERKVQEQAFAAVIANLEKEKEGYKFNFDERIRLAEEEARLIAQKYGEGSAQAIIAEKRVTEEKQKQVAQRIALADIEQRSQEAMFKHDIEMARLVEDQKVALGLESNAQRLANESAYISALYAKDLEGINARIAAWTEAEGPEALARLNAEKLKIEEAYQLQLTKIDNAAVLDREKYAIEATKAIESEMSNLLANLITNTKNWKQTLMDAFKALDDQLVKIAANQLVQQYLGAGSAGGGFLSGLMSKIFGGGAGGATPQLAATSANTTAITALTAAITANTAALGSSTFSSAFGGGSSFGSFFGGGDFIGGLFPVFDQGSPYVPQDMLAMVHRGEAIIPASQNQPGGFGGSVNMRNTFMFSGPVDSRTQAQIAVVTQRAVERATRRTRI